MNTSFLILASIAVRNPFWPIDYEGTLEPITAEPRVVETVVAEPEIDDTTTAAAAAAAALAAKAAEEEAKANYERERSKRAWSDARKLLRVGGTTTVTDPDGTKHHAVMINGYAYGDGDLISVNHRKHRFTWRVSDLSDDGTLKLQRIRTKELD